MSTVPRSRAALFVIGLLLPVVILGATLAITLFAVDHQTDDAWRWLLGEDRVVVVILASTGVALGVLGVAVVRAWRRARPLAYGVLASFVTLVSLVLGWVFLADGLRGAIPG